MANCFNCSTVLKFSNKPLFGGKTSNGDKLCLDCFRKLSNVNMVAANKMSGHQTEYILSQLAISNENNQRLEQIKEEIKSLGMDNMTVILGRKEIEELPSILHIDEKIIATVQGNYNDRIGLLVCTDARIIFIDKGLVYGLKVEEFLIDKISSIQYETGMIFGDIKIHASSNVAKIKQVDKNSAKLFVELYRNLQFDKNQPSNKVVASSDESILDKIQKLAELKEAGYLTEEEFANKKSDLLSRL